MNDDHTKGHKPITEAELKSLDQFIEAERRRGAAVDDDLVRLIAEVRRLRAALESYGVTAFWDGMGDMIWSPYTPELRSVPGWVLARKALGWPEPSEPCDNPSCDGVRDDPNYPGDGPDGMVHRHFKDGHWLDDGSEM